MSSGNVRHRSHRPRDVLATALGVALLSSVALGGPAHADNTGSGTKQFRVVEGIVGEVTSVSGVTTWVGGHVTVNGVRKMRCSYLEKSTYTVSGSTTRASNMRSGLDHLNLPEANKGLYNDVSDLDNNAGQAIEQNAAFHRDYPPNTVCPSPLRALQDTPAGSLNVAAGFAEFMALTGTVSAVTAMAARYNSGWPALAAFQGVAGCVGGVAARLVSEAVLYGSIRSNAYNYLGTCASTAAKFYYFNRLFSGMSENPHWLKDTIGQALSYLYGSSTAARDALSSAVQTVINACKRRSDDGEPELRRRAVGA